MVYHMMPNLPGSTPERDVSMFYDLFHDSRFHPDMLKIYPCAVLAGTQLYEEYLRGEHVAYSDEVLGQVLAGAKKYVPPHVRIQRVVRDIPAAHILAGSKLSNFRELIKKDMEQNHWSCKCIRCREIREENIPAEDFELVEREYRTTRGKEYFLSFETRDRKKLASFIRLRIPDDSRHVPFPELYGAALVRELHTYGIHTRVGEGGTQAQHVGFGRRLVARAEEIASEHGCKKVAIISGVGVRKYYEKLGYRLEGTYMVKEIEERG
jgi:elongator complex protein 3